MKVRIILHCSCGDRLSISARRFSDQSSERTLSNFSRIIHCSRWIFFVLSWHRHNMQDSSSVDCICMDALINQQSRGIHDVACQLTSAAIGFFFDTKDSILDAMSVLKFSLVVLLCSTVQVSSSTRSSASKDWHRDDLTYFKDRIRFSWCLFGMVGRLESVEWIKASYLFQCETCRW